MFIIGYTTNMSYSIVWVITNLCNRYWYADPHNAVSYVRWEWIRLWYSNLKLHVLSAHLNFNAYFPLAIFLLMWSMWSLHSSSSSMYMPQKCSTVHSLNILSSQSNGILMSYMLFHAFSGLNNIKCFFFVCSRRMYCHISSLIIVHDL